MVSALRATADRRRGNQTTIGEFLIDSLVVVIAIFLIILFRYEARKMLAEGHGPSDIQKQANNAYRQLTCEEELRKTADEENCANPSDTRIPRQRLVKKIVANHAKATIRL